MKQAATFVYADGKRCKRERKNTCPRREWRRCRELCPTRQEGMGPSPPVEVLVIEGSRESFFSGKMTQALGHISWGQTQPPHAVTECCFG